MVQNPNSVNQPLLDAIEAALAVLLGPLSADMDRHCGEEVDVLLIVIEKQKPGRDHGVTLAASSFRDQALLSDVLQDLTRQLHLGVNVSHLRVKKGGADDQQN